MTEINITSPVTATQAVDIATAGAFSVITPSVLYNNFVQLDATGKLPPVDGSQVKNIVVSQCIQQVSAPSGTIALMVVPFALTVVRIVLIPTVTTSGSDGSNYWQAEVLNKKQAHADLISSNKLTSTEEFTAFTMWDPGADQNLNLAANDVLQGQIGKTGSPTSLTDQNFTWVIDYYKSA